MLQTGTVVCAKYEILKEIGRGGMSVVYQARDYVTGQLLAIKDVERNGEQDNRIVVQSLAGEGRLLKRLSNPHLPRIYDIIEDTDSFMVVMDYIEGISLDRVIATHGAQSEANVYSWGMQICEVFDYLHHQTPPIVYRDMKPANIMLLADGNIMMIDFGTARTQKLGVTLQSDTVCIGTEGFAAPEQFGGISQSDARTDIFCLGATLYNMITGHSPCDRPKGILPLKDFNPELEKSPLNYIIARCTRNDPDERYQTAMELYEDLRQASIGAFRAPGKREKQRGSWQKQAVKGRNGSTGGLSGLLKSMGKSGSLSGTLQENKALERIPVEPVVSSPPAVADGWKQVSAFSPQNEFIPELLPEEQPPDSRWKKLTIISAIFVVLLVVLSVVCMLANNATIAYVLLITAFGALALTVVGTIGLLRERNMSN